MLGKKLIKAAAGAGGETDDDFASTVLLLHGDGTNGAQNNTFLDSSTNNFTITRNGNCSMGSYSPFSKPDGRWGNYFDGSGDYLDVGSDANLTIGTSDFTISMWVYFTTTPGGTTIRLFEGRSSTVSNQVIPDIFYSATTTSLVYSVNGTVRIDSGVTPVANQWYSITVSRLSGTTRMFIDGTQAGSDYSDSLTYVAFDSDRPRLGSRGNNSGAGLYFTGYLSNVQVLVGTGYSSFSTPTTPFTNITNTQLLTCQSNRFVDNSTNNFAITAAGNVKVTPFSPFPITTEYSPSVNGGSGYFDGSGDYLDASSTLKDLGTGDFCIEFWVYTAATNGIVVDTRSDTNVGWMIYIDTTIRFYHAGSSRVDGSIQLNSYNHIAITRSSGTLRLFVNGAQADSTTYATNLSDGDDFRIGRITNSASSVPDLSGYLSSLRIVAGSAVYTSAFTPPTAPLTAIANTSLLCNFTNAGIYDNTGVSVLESVGNSQISTTTKRYGTGAIKSDGTGDSLYIANTEMAFGTGDFTLEFWFYEPSGVSGNGGIFDTRSATTNADGFLIQRIDTKALRIFVTAAVITSAGNTIVQDTWQFIVVTRQSGTMRLYVDGVQTNSTANTTNMTNTTCTIFNNVARTQSLNGFLDDMRVTRGICRYPDGTTFTPPTKAFPNIGS